MAPDRLTPLNAKPIIGTLLTKISRDEHLSQFFYIELVAYRFEYVLRARMLGYDSA